MLIKHLLTDQPDDPHLPSQARRQWLTRMAKAGAGTVILSLVGPQIARGANIVGRWGGTNIVGRWHWRSNTTGCWRGANKKNPGRRTAVRRAGAVPAAPAEKGFAGANRRI